MTPLSQLKDIHLPEPVGYWPPAWGWWLLVVLLIALTAVVTHWTLNFVRRRRARKQAIKYLADIDQKQDDWPVQLNHLLKRIALTYYPQDKVANLYGQEWLKTMQAMLPDKKRASFEQTIGPMLDGLYQQKDQRQSADCEACKTQCLQWIKHAAPPGRKQLQLFALNGGEHV